MNLIKEEEIDKESLGRTFSDVLTGFTGIATSICHSLDQPTMVHLENADTSRWVPVGRITK